MREKYENAIAEIHMISIKTINKKHKEYAMDGDVFHNFNVASALQGCTPETALLGMMDKHIVSIHDFVKFEEKHPEELIPIDMWTEKIQDAINYLTILYAMKKLKKD